MAQVPGDRDAEEEQQNEGSEGAPGSCRAGDKGPRDGELSQWKQVPSTQLSSRTPNSPMARPSPAGRVASPSRRRGHGRQQSLPCRRAIAIVARLAAGSVVQGETTNPLQHPALHRQRSGRGWVRTSDLSRVKRRFVRDPAPPRVKSASQVASTTVRNLSRTLSPTPANTLDRIELDRTLSQDRSAMDRIAQDS